jgi:hypothetical protein
MKQLTLKIIGAMAGSAMIALDAQVLLRAESSNRDRLFRRLPQHG